MKGKIRIDTVYKYAFLVLFLTSMITLSALKYISSNLNEYQHNYRENLKELKISALKSERSASYNLYIKRGNTYLEAENTSEAMRSFLDAKKLSTQGIRANLGITKCLLIQCSTTKQHCELAEEYYALMMKSELIKNDTKEILRALKIN